MGGEAEQNGAAGVGDAAIGEGATDRGQQWSLEEGARWCGEGPVEVRGGLGRWAGWEVGGAAGGESAAG